MTWTRLFVSDYFPLFVAFVATVPLLAGWACYRVAMHPRVVAVFVPRDLQTSYLGALTLPFALFLAFMVSDIWNRETLYAKTVLQEVQKLDSMLDVARVCGPVCAPIDDAVGVYARALSRYEWDEGWVRPQAEVSATFEALVDAIGRAEADSAIPIYIRSVLLTGQTELRRLRTDRYFILHADLAPHRWIVVMVLGLLSLIGLAALHVGKPYQLILGLSTFAIAFSMTLAYTVVLAWPTVDESIIPSEQLRRVLE